MMKSGKLLSQAIEILNGGGIIVFPTDTAFGVGCRLDKPKAIARLFKIRRRPKIQPAPVLVSSVAMAKKYLLSLPESAEKLMEEHWPGALTVIYPCLVSKVPGLVRGGGKTLGVRMPNHPLALQLIEGVGVPILGPSANFHGEPTPYQFENLDEDFLKLVDLVFPGECQTGLVSTVLDCSKEPWRVIRQGAVKI